MFKSSGFPTLKYIVLICPLLCDIVVLLVSGFPQRSYYNNQNLQSIPNFLKPLNLNGGQNYPDYTDIISNPRPDPEDEEKAAAAKEQRAKLCGEISDYEPNKYYHNESRNCYREGTQGPCGENMQIYTSNGIHGYCDCRETNRIYIYHQERRNCYPIFSQAHCGANEWLTLESNGQPKCESNPCAKFNTKGKNEFIYYQNKCSELQTDCGASGQYFIYTFIANKINPICGYQQFPSNSFGIVDLSEESKCRPGSLKSVTGECNAKIIF